MVLFYHLRKKAQVRTILCDTTQKDTVRRLCMEAKATCPVETTLELIGGKYKALILWHLSAGKLRFSELRQRVSSATPKMLTQQLRELEKNQLVHREVYPVIPPKVEYSLTETGRSLMPVLVAIRDWGSDYLRKNHQDPNCFMIGSEPMAQS